MEIRLAFSIQFLLNMPLFQMSIQIKNGHCHKIKALSGIFTNSFAKFIQKKKKKGLNTYIFRRKKNL